MEYSLENFLVADQFLVTGLGTTYEVGAGEWTMYKSLNYNPPRTVIEVQTSGDLIAFDAQTGQSVSGAYVISLPDPLTQIHLVIRPGGEARWFLNQDQAQAAASSTNSLDSSVGLFLPLNFK